MASLFPTHNYGQQTTIGTVEHLKIPSLKRNQEYYNINYVPNNRRSFFEVILILICIKKLINCLIYAAETCE